MRFADQEVSPGIGYNIWATTGAGKKSEEGSSIVSDETGARMSFLDHLSELRSRLIHTVIAILIAFLGLSGVRGAGFRHIGCSSNKTSAERSSLVFTGLPDPFFIYLKVSFIMGIFISLPYVLYQLWQFISPGLYQRNEKWPFLSSHWPHCYFIQGLFSPTS